MSTSNKSLMPSSAQSDSDELFILNRIGINIRCMCRWKHECKATQLELQAHQKNSVLSGFTEIRIPGELRQQEDGGKLTKKSMHKQIYLQRSATLLGVDYNNMIAKERVYISKHHWRRSVHDFIGGKGRGYSYANLYHFQSRLELQLITGNSDNLDIIREWRGQVHAFLLPNNTVDEWVGLRVNNLKRRMNIQQTSCSANGSNNGSNDGEQSGSSMLSQQIKHQTTNVRSHPIKQQQQKKKKKKKSGGLQPMQTSQLRRSLRIHHLLEAQSTIVMMESPRIMKEVCTFLETLFLNPFRSPSSGDLGLVVTVDSSYGNTPLFNIERLTYLKQSYSVSCLHSSDGDKTSRMAYVYGAGTGSSSFGVQKSQQCCREMPPSLLSIRDAVQKQMVKSFQNDQTVNHSVTLNTCEVICYYGDKGIPWHRDTTRSRDGKYIHASNSQVESTVVCVLVIGDSRQLMMALHNFDGKKVGQIQMIELNHGSIFFLHPNDEKDVMRVIAGRNVRSHYRHRSTGVRGTSGEFSIGFVFRACKTLHRVNRDSGMFIYDDLKMSETALKCNKILDTFITEKDGTQSRIVSDFTRVEAQNFMKEMFFHIRNKYLS